MSPPCRRPATLTSGDHPEPDPDLSSPGNPGLREPHCRTFGPAFAGHSALAVRVQRTSLSKGGIYGTTPGGLKAPRCRLGAKQEGEAAYWAFGGEGRRARFAGA